jgi:hypothetical protein
MEGLENVWLHCPYCGENIEIVVDTSAGDSEYIEDCSVCCRPILLCASGDGDALQVSARREDD